MLRFTGLSGEPSHLSQTAYDLLRIGAWALVIVAGLVGPSAG
jgi:hypothetical protein